MCTKKGEQFSRVVDPALKTLKLGFWQLIKKTTCTSTQSTGIFLNWQFSKNENVRRMFTKKQEKILLDFVVPAEVKMFYFFTSIRKKNFS